MAEKVGVTAGMGVATAWLTAYATGKQQIKKSQEKRLEKMQRNGKPRQEEGRKEREGNVEDVE